MCYVRGQEQGSFRGRGRPGEHTSVEAKSSGSSGKPNDEPHVMLYREDIWLYIEAYEETIQTIHLL